MSLSILINNLSAKINHKSNEWQPSSSEKKIVNFYVKTFVKKVIKKYHSVERIWNYMNLTKDPDNTKKLFF